MEILKTIGTYVGGGVLGILYIALMIVMSALPIALGIWIVIKIL